MMKEAGPQHGAGGAMGGVVHPDELVAGELGAEAAVLDAVLGGTGVCGALPPEGLPLYGYATGALGLLLALEVLAVVADEAACGEDG